MTERTRPFADFLQEQAKGSSHAELSEGLQELVAKVKDTGKKGSITYKVFIEPMKGDHAALVVTDEITLRLPEHDRQSSLFFADRDNNLTRNDPNQFAFEPLRDVSDPVPDDVDPRTGEIRQSGATS